MATDYHYNIELPEDVSKILEQDFWMLENIGPMMLKSLTEPVKFAATSWIIVTKGSCRADINLVTHEITAPALVTVRSTQILQPTYISPDFNASVMVMSMRFMEKIFMYSGNSSFYSISARHHVVKFPEEEMPEYEKFMASMRDIIADKKNPYGSQALVFQIMLFIYKVGYKCYEPYKNEVTSRQGRLSDQFLFLVQDNFREHRFLDFYAQKMKITPKHLSRTVKVQTGYSAVEWIERFVILEAKVLLKSSNLNIQQIADELHFPSQSFFGKYFKKLTGMSPKEYRNS